MPLQSRVDREVVVLSNLGHLMNEPTHFDAVREVDDALDAGYRDFVVELGDVRSARGAFLGLLMTLSRRVRQRGGEVVLARVGPALERTFEEMRMDGEWDVFRNVAEAVASYRRPGPTDRS